MTPVRTFFVEDNPVVLENLVATLRELSPVVPVADAATEAGARAWLSENPTLWDLLIVDIFLQQGTGLRVLEACSARQPGQKVVVLSNHVAKDLRLKCWQLGADAVFDKATELEELIAFCKDPQRRPVDA